MAMNPEQVGRLLKMLEQTRDIELTCPQCLEELDKYAQSILDGAPQDALLARVREHLEACSFCDEEFELILATLDVLDEP